MRLLFSILIHLRYLALRLRGRAVRKRPRPRLIYTNENNHDELPLDSALVEHGRKVAASSHLDICCLARDVEETLEANVAFIATLGAHWRSWRLIVVENGSRDRTPKILDRLARQHPLVILGQDLRFEATRRYQITPERMHKMQVLRNVYVDYLRAHPMPESPRRGARQREGQLCGILPHSGWPGLTMVFDIDLSLALYVEGMFHAAGFLDQHADVDAVVPKLLDAQHTMRDTYAYMEETPYAFENQTLHEARHAAMKWRTRGDRQPKRVLSAFGGLAIYRAASITRASYSGRVDTCEHYNLSKSLSLYWDPHFLIYAL